jgi:predicted aminopeptidase
MATRAFLMVVTLAGCLPARHLVQAAYGHLDLQARAEPIDELVASGRAPPRLRRLLASVRGIKAFGVAHGLALSDSYQRYAELDRQAAVWVVTACAPLAFEPKTWTFPLAGSFTYLGWFDAQDAQRYADWLARDGWDVHVRGSSAYSTLGWFRDPILSTMLTRGASVVGDLANTVLHESVHATIYVEGQSSFNESIALYIADGLTPLYLAQAYGQKSYAMRAYLTEERRRKADERRLQAAYDRLTAVYTSDLDDLEKLVGKQAILLELERDIGAEVSINNATLIGFHTYRTGLDQLAELHVACKGDWARLVAALRSVTAAAFNEEQQKDLTPVLAPLIKAGCLPARD